MFTGSGGSQAFMRACPDGARPHKSKTGNPGCYDDEDMFFFGHTGITRGAAGLIANLPPVQARARASRQESRAPVARGSAPVRGPSWFDALARAVDIRVLLIGSLLPDIIDKPLGLIFYQHQLRSNGRTYAHTLLFLLVIASLGTYIYRRSRRNWPLVLSFGTAMHLLLDSMWRSPSTLFWPAMGFGFAKGDLSEWISEWLRAMGTNPAVYVPEAIGLAVVASLAYVVIARRRAWVFIRRGNIKWNRGRPTIIPTN